MFFALGCIIRVMVKGEIIKTAAINSFLTASYIVFVGGQARIGIDNKFLAPIAMLLLFVTSAGITSWLIFGKPALLYMSGKKNEAVSLLSYTLIFMFVTTVFVLLLLTLTAI